MFKLMFEVSRNPLELRKTPLSFANMIPEDFVGGRQKAKAPTQKGLSLSMATEMLKLVFFSLSNDNIPYYHEKHLPTHDKLVLHFIEAVSSSNPEIISGILSGQCATTNAVKEAIYGSAIRERHCGIVSRLLESGIGPNTKVRGWRYRQCDMKRGIIELRWIWRTMRWSGLHEAAFACDIRLAKILLNAGASANSTCIGDISALAIAASGGGDTGASDNSVKFARLLIEHGALVEDSASCRRCRRLKLIMPIALSIATRNAPLAEYLIERDASLGSHQYAGPSCYYKDSRFAGKLDELGINPTPLQIAIVSGSKDITRRLLQPVLFHPAQASTYDVKRSLVASCLAGDADTASKLLTYHPSILTINELWARGAIPLVTTAWNKDITIAELLLGLDVRVGPRYEDGILQTSTPAPIHVAAYNGNTSLVRHLICRGADCNVQYIPTSGHLHPDPLFWLLPGVVASPLQLALWSGSGETAALLISHHSNMPGGKLDQAVDLSMSISDLAFEGANVLSANRNVDGPCGHGRNRRCDINYPVIFLLGRIVSI